MPKSSKTQIDKDEKKVIHELQKNAKESIDTIALRCNFSRQKVWRIIKRLEKKGLIEMDEQEIRLTKLGDIWRYNVCWEFSRQDNP